MKETSLYIHIPYCRSKCIYCDFYSGGYRGADWDRLVASICNELLVRKCELRSKPTTIYIGGGTPSLLPPKQFVKMVDAVDAIFGGLDKIQEFTIEVNPDDVAPELCDVWKSKGVTRVSMGIQSFNANELKLIGRRHSPDCSFRSFNMLRDRFDNVSVDLMFGLPGQTIGSWRNNIEEVIGLAPEHISAYSLMFEEGTAMTLMRRQGKMSFPSEDECVAMWKMLSDMLEKAGYLQYEISNYSKPGMESIHNSRYWNGNPYLGIGPSAHSYDGLRTRRANPCDLKGYLNFYSQDSVKADVHVSHSFYVEELLTDEELLEEMILTRMRMKRGLDLSEVEARFGTDVARRIMSNAKSYIKQGVLMFDGMFLALSKDGVMICDEIVLDLAM